MARQIGKRDLILEITDLPRPRGGAVPDLWLCAAPIKKGRIDWIAEKACELGVDRLVPVLTRAQRGRQAQSRAAPHAHDRSGRAMRAHCAARLDEMVKLSALLRDWPAARALFFADEAGGVNAIEAMRDHPGPAAILIRPEEAGSTMPNAKRSGRIPGRSGSR